MAAQGRCPRQAFRALNGSARPARTAFFAQFPAFAAHRKTRAAICRKRAFFDLHGTRFSVHFPRFAAVRRTFPPYPCMKFLGCRDDGEMHEKGLTPTIARASAVFLQAAVHFARVLAAGRTPRRALPHFSCSASRPRRALLGFSCRPPNPIRALPLFSCSQPHLRRALPPVPCSWPHPCRALRGNPCSPPNPRRALPCFSCSQACTSPDSLQGHNFVQGNRGSARRKARRTPVSPCTSAISLQAAVHFACFLARVRGNARIRGKCTTGCKDSGEVHVPVQEYGGSARPRAGRRAKCMASCGNRGEVHGCPAAASSCSRAFSQNSANRCKARTHIGPSARLAWQRGLRAECGPSARPAWRRGLRAECGPGGQIQRKA